MTLTLERPKYKRRIHKIPAAWFPDRQCNHCNSQIDDDEDVYCDTCADHSDCIDEDEGQVFERSVLREHARSLKHAMQEARRANLNLAASRIEDVLRTIYPEWPGLVVP